MASFCNFRSFWSLAPDAHAACIISRQEPHTGGFQRLLNPGNGRDMARNKAISGLESLHCSGPDLGLFCEIALIPAEKRAGSTNLFRIKHRT